MKYFNLLMIFISVLLISSCDKKSTYSVTNGIASINPADAGAEDVSVVPWTVGILGKQKVAKGVNIKIKFPQLENEAIEDLVDRGINSWLIRVRRRYLGRSEILGFLYVPIALPGPEGSSSFRVKQTKGGFFSVYYAAASISTRFEKFNCPAFEHNLWIEDTDVIEEKGASGELISTSPSEMETISGKVEAFSYSPITLNGGKSLSGEYVIDIALYNHQNKRKFSNYLELSQKVKVGKEVPVSLEGCAGFKIPPKEEEETKTFKFGR